GRIAFAGSHSDFPSDADAAERIDCGGRWITPGLVDCHTHLVFGGNRAHEFELRLQGASYEQIARAGGGIVSTVAATRGSSEAELADAVDAFMEGIAFSKDQTARVFRAAKALGLPVKLHADQLSNLGGAALASEFSALSADHLEHTDEAGVAAMARAGTVAVLLPGAFYFIRETMKPPVELFRARGVNMALATDCNPGSSPLTSLLLAMNMGATLFRMTVAECLAGVTREGARALGILGET